MRADVDDRSALWQRAVLRATGGLADTVFAADYGEKPYHELNGYMFNDFNYEGIESALRHAVGM